MPQHRPQLEPAEASCSPTAPEARGSSQLLDTWQPGHGMLRQPGLPPGRSLSGTRTVTHSLQLTPSPTEQGTATGPHQSPAQPRVMAACPTKWG